MIGVKIALRTYYAWLAWTSRGELWEATITEILASYQPDENGRRNRPFTSQTVRVALIGAYITEWE